MCINLNNRHPRYYLFVGVYFALLYLLPLLQSLVPRAGPPYAWRNIQFCVSGNHGGTLECHLSQDMKVPSFNFNKEKKFNELEIMRDI